MFRLFKKKKKGYSVSIYTKTLPKENRVWIQYSRV